MDCGKKLSIFLENNQAQQNRHGAYRYENPVTLICARDADEIDRAFAGIEQAISDGLHVAGWISYEAGLYFENKLKPLMPETLDYPLIYMGVYEDRQVISARDAGHYWRDREDSGAYKLSDLKLSLSRGEYETAFDKIQSYLKAGDIYQVNFTQKARFDFDGSVKAFYAALRNAQAVEYAAFIESDELNVLSLSPELFIRKKGTRLTAKPMKGTCRRGRTTEEDKQLSASLFASEKERAENLMIVDLLRNDLSRYAKSASVSVSSLYDVEKYRTLFTMTSTINAQLNEGKSAVDLLRAIFPCGSVTGAPKIRAQQIISELESGPRGIYTGAIGYFTPDGDMCFSVPIRTITIDRDGHGELGIGGAIVADSVAQKEYDECLLKAQFVTRNHPRFDLIESLRWSGEAGFNHLNYHMERLADTAEYFSFEIDLADIENQLKVHVSHLPQEGGRIFKIRLLVSPAGSVSITSEEIQPKHEEAPRRVVISDKAMDSQQVSLFHKTTQRDSYQRELEKYRKLTGCTDVLFCNERGELTEGSYTNLFIKKDGIYYTPPVNCGLLAGVFRRDFLSRKGDRAREKVLYPDDLKNADQIFIANSVRGLMAVELVEL